MTTGDGKEDVGFFFFFFEKRKTKRKKMTEDEKRVVCEWCFTGEEEG